MLEGLVEEVTDLGAFAMEFDAVEAGVGKDGDEATGAGEDAVNGPGGEGEGFAGLAAPKEDLVAGGVVFEDLLLVRTEREEGRVGNGDFGLGILRGGRGWSH